MASDFYTKVVNSLECEINRAGIKRKRNLKQFSASGHLQFVAMDVMGPLPKATTGNQFIIIIMD